MTVIELNDVSLQVNRKMAAEHLTMSVSQGETVALVGNAGAGKRSVLSLLSGETVPFSGQALVLDYDVATKQKKVRHAVASAPAENIFLPYLTVKENIEFVYKLNGKRKKEAAIRAVRLMANFELLDKADAVAKRLTGEYATRLNVALAAANEPPLLLLHEPTKKLKPYFKREFLDLLVRQKGKRTLVFSTESIYEAACVADRIAVLHKGKLIAFGTEKALLAQTETAHIEDAYSALLESEAAV